MSAFLDLKITEAGKLAAFNAASTGVDVEITHVGFGDSFKTPDGTETSLIHEVKRVVVGGGSRVAVDQIRIWGLWSSDTDNSDIREIGIYAGSVLFAYYSRSDGAIIGRKTAGGDFVFYYDWKLSGIPTEVISVVVDPSAATAIAVLAVHEADLMAHDHFMRRASMAQEGESFKWGGLAEGTSTVIELTLPFESLLTSYVAGQVFRFIAQYGNSGPTGLKVNGLELRSVRKYGNTALVSGDLIKGSIYEVTYDGSNFQLNSGIGGSAETVTPEGDVFFVHSFAATAGQTVFEIPYNIGSLMVFRGGDIVQPEHFTATDGITVVFPTGSTAGQEVVIVTFRALAASNVYTKPQTYSRAEIGDLLSGKQNSLGFTPVQQGGGAGQQANKVRIGYSGTALLGQVDNIELGNFWLSSNFDPAKKADLPVIKTYEESTQLVASDMGDVRVTAATSVVVTLPSAIGLAGREVTIRRMDSNPNTTLRVRTISSGQKVYFHQHLLSTGYQFFYLMGAGDFWTLRSDGASWFLVSRLDGSPVGEARHATSTLIPPGGYGIPSGQILTRADWPWLWDHARLSGMIVSEGNRAGREGCWTTGNGTTTFRTPEVRGEFIRAWDEYRGIDSNRTAGSWQIGSLVTYDLYSGVGVQGSRASSTDYDNPVGFGADPVTASKYPGILGAGVGAISSPPLGTGAVIGMARPRNIALPTRIKMI